MALKKRGGHFYGKTLADRREVLLKYSQDEYVAEHFAEPRCTCGHEVFAVLLDDEEGCAVRVCVECKSRHPIGDSADYLDSADLDECACPCGFEQFELTIGVALYEGSADVKWIYLCCRCVKCGLIAVYGDWKNEFEDYRELLKLV